MTIMSIRGVHEKNESIVRCIGSRDIPLLYDLIFIPFKTPYSPPSWLLLLVLIYGQ